MKKKIKFLTNREWLQKHYPECLSDFLYIGGCKSCPQDYHLDATRFYREYALL